MAYKSVTVTAPPIFRSLGSAPSACDCLASCPSVIGIAFLHWHRLSLFRIRVYISYKIYYLEGNREKQGLFIRGRGQMSERNSNKDWTSAVHRRESSLCVAEIRWYLIPNCLILLKWWSDREYQKLLQAFKPCMCKVRTYAKNVWYRQVHGVATVHCAQC